MKTEVLTYLDGLWAGFSCRVPYAYNPYWPVDPLHNVWARGWQDGRKRLNEIVDEGKD
jgi:hypothetical protein